MNRLCKSISGCSNENQFMAAPHETMDGGATATDGGATAAQRRPNNHTLKWGSWKAYKPRDKA